MTQSQAQEDAVEAAAWKILEVKLHQAASSVLEVAPHLQHLSANVVRDPHLKMTWKLWNAFMGKDVSDSIINILQSQSLSQSPLVYLENHPAGPIC